MQKKLLIGLSAVGLATAFWACGDGAVVPMDDSTDGYVKAMLETGSIPFKENIGDAMTKCNEDPQCFNDMAKAQGAAVNISSEEEATSSSDVGPASSATVYSSSINTFYSSSSLGPIGPIGGVSSSSADPIVSSSSVVTPTDPTAFGTCAPAKATVELNEATTWSFTKGAGLKSAMAILSAEFEWTLTDGTPATASVKGNTSSGSVSYGKSGVKNASVKVTTSEGTQTIACSPLQVNGAPITGCKCMPTNIAPDVAEGQSATWTATGCVTTGANITGYTWTGATADATGLVATAAVAAKNDIVSGVSFTVSNDDNTKVTVPCDDAKAVDGNAPDYMFVLEDADQIPNKSVQSFNVKNEGCMSIKGTWANAGYSPTVQVLCDMSATSSPVTFEMTYGAKTYTVAGQSWGFSNAGGQIASLANGAVDIKNICVTFTGAETVTCYLQ